MKQVDTEKIERNITELIENSGYVDSLGDMIFGPASWISPEYRAKPIYGSLGVLSMLDRSCRISILVDGLKACSDVANSHLYLSSQKPNTNLISGIKAFFHQRNYNNGLNQLYDWLQDSDKSPDYHKIRISVSARTLTILSREHQVPLEENVSAQLERIPEEYLMNVEDVVLRGSQRWRNEIGFGFPGSDRLRITIN